MSKQILAFRLRVLFLGCFLCLPGTVYGTEISLEVLVQSVQDRFDKTRSFKGTFTQTAFLKTLKREHVSKGRVFFKKPGKMRWEYDSPEEQLIVSDGHFFWFYIPEDKQVMKKSSKGALDSTVSNLFLMGNVKLIDAFDIAKSIGEKGDKDKHYLIMKPKEPHPNMSEIVLGVNKKNFVVEETIITDYYSNRTSVLLSDIETNVDLNEKMFNFVPPKGVRVIEGGH